MKKNFRAIYLMLFSLIASVNLLIAQTTVTLQAAGDAEIWTDRVNENYGSCDKLYINRGPQQRDLLSFNISGLPANALITSAELRLVKIGGNNTSYAISAHAITEVWTEGTGACGNGQANANATWNNRTTSTPWSTAGGVFQAAESSTNVVGNATYSWSVTNMARAWKSGSLTNNGILLKFVTEGGSNQEKEFASRQNATTANRPILSVTYTLLTATVSSTDITCNGGSDGSITVTGAAGGTAPYQYRINGGTFQSSNVFSGLTLGTYNVDVRDANNNIVALGSRTINQPTVLNANVAKSNATCFGASDGSITVSSPSGGGGTYQYRLGTGTWQVSGSFTGLATGSYSVQIRDAVATSCVVALGSQFVDQPTVLNAAVAKTNIICNGAGNGTITVTSPSGGGGTYQYRLDAGTWQGSGSFTGLAANTYSVQIRDAASIACVTVLGNQTITQPAVLAGTISNQTNVLCRGGSTGAITVAGSGGTGSYQYRLGAGSFGASGTFNSLPAGANTITVRDANLCTAAVNFTITQPAAVVAVTPTITQPSCFAFGIITLAASGGTAPYTYDWADIAGTNNPKDRGGLSAGNYSVVVIDANGCTVSSGTITLTAPLNCAPVNICKNGPAYQFSVDPDPSIATYTWTVPSGAVIVTGQGTPQISVNWSGVTAGVYSVCVTAANTCGTTAQTCQNVNIVDPPVPVVSAGPACAGSNIQLFASGGASYQWSGPNSFTSSQANPVIPNASAANNGTYSVVVTNANGCTDTATVNVTVSAAPTLSGVVTAATCALPQGAINITVNPAGTYTYSWSNGATTEDISGLNGGVYSVTATSSTGCSVQGAYAVNSVPGPIPSGTPVNLTCFGATTGSIGSVAITSGVGPFSYAWTGPGGFTATTANISGLAAGTYNLVVTDANNCKGGYTATLTQPSAININFSSVNVNCFGANTGNIDLTVTGGTGAYSYVWLKNSSPFSGNVQDLTGLTAGTYQVTVTDANSCTAVQSITITQPDAVLSATSTITNVSCFGGNNGQVVLTPTGGTAPYTYAWTGPSFVSATKDISGRIAGTYNVTITDAKGCTFTISNIIISQSSLLTVATITNTPVSCFGGNNGVIEVLPSGGTAPFTYQWSNGANTALVTGLAANNYSVTVTDAFGCTPASAPVIVVSQPAAALAVTATPVAVSCFGSSSGAVNTVVSGGTTGYNYLWSTNATTPNLSNIAAGSYGLTVTDAKGCTALATATVVSPADIELSGAITNIACNGASTGAITLSVSGGTGPFGYQWLSGPAVQNRTNLAAGTYTVTVTDANSCTDTKSFTVAESTPILASAVNSNISCFGGSNGVIDLSVSGGLSPYSYLWSNSATTQDISGLIAGPYSVTVTDANSCSVMFNAANIENPVVLTLAVAADKDVDCYGGADGGATATPAGGTGPYIYQWSDGGTGAIRTNLAAGLFTVTVTDNNGCTAQAAILINQPESLTLFAETSNTNACGQAPSGSIVLTVQDGTAPYTYSWTRNGGGFSANTKDIGGLAAGIYTVTVTDNNSCSRQLVVEVGTQVSTLASTISKTDITCFGFPNNINGTATVAPTGGTLPYTYDWNATPIGDGSPNITGLAAGNYNVTVTDAGGCTTVANITINGTTCTTPVAVNDTFSNCDGGVITGNVSTNDSINGVPLNQMTFINLGVPNETEGILVWNSSFDGSFTFTPDPAFTGTLVIPYKVEDPFGVSDTGSIYITIGNCIIPDLTPVIEMPLNTFVVNETKDLVVYLEEVKGAETLPGFTTFTLTVPGGYQLSSFNAGLSSIIPSGGSQTAVSNGDWNVLFQDGTQIILRAKAGIKVDAFGVSFIGFSVTRTTSISQATANMTADIIPDGTQKRYDSNNDNNTYSRVIVSN